jgi:hypothetical protein
LLPAHQFQHRRGNEMKRFTDLSACIATELKVTDAVLDTEVCALDGDGRPAFYDLMKRQFQAVYYVFEYSLAEWPRPARFAASRAERKFSAKSPRVNFLGLDGEL